MFNKLTALVIIIMLIILIPVTLYVFNRYFSDQKEQFNVSPSELERLPNYAYNNYDDINNKISNTNIKKDCYKLGPADCISCSHCGISTDSAGVSTCLPGDVAGPFFNYTSDNWIYGNNYDRYIFGETVVEDYEPWNHDYKNIIADPIAMAM